jgi:hypothetical protein
MNAAFYLTERKGAQVATKKEIKETNTLFRQSKYVWRAQ